ncbi:MAG: c-type cytochrome, partial [Planctomycetaceae bacterium]
NHVTSGAEFGWRSGTGKWPEWYEDSLGSVIDIGPGSPTGIAFGTNAKFPAKYQHALFISDWSYGEVYAVRMTPDGSSYTGKSERFLSAAPLPVTDLVVNPHDGAFYFTIGGRRTQSGLYRVTHADAKTAKLVEPASANQADRELRHKLESLHRDNITDEELAFAWKHLGHSDRHTRYAARIALEHTPLEKWQAKALQESDPAKLIPALIALCRCGDESMQMPIIQSLAQVAGSDLEPHLELASLRVLELAFCRLGEPAEGLANAVGTALDGLYPASDFRMNRELSQLLIYLQHESAAEKTLDLMASAASQEEQIQYALWLRNLEKGWTPKLRRQYFNWFNEAGAFRGGNSFSRFLKNIRDEALAKLGDSEKKELADVLEVKQAPIDPTAKLNARPVVKKWTVSELLPMVAADDGKRDFEVGKQMFEITACYKCHRFAGTGGIVGPDLTGVAGRFNNQNLLESMVEPSKVISDQYEATSFLLENGKTVTGRVANLNGKRIMVIDDMLNPGKMVQVNVNEIEEQMISKTSMMPSGLLNRLSSDEILNLVAYLKSGGDPNHSVYKSGQ